MRISDWSSDVCSSDLGRRVPAARCIPQTLRSTAGIRQGARRADGGLCPQRAARRLIARGKTIEHSHGTNLCDELQEIEMQMQETATRAQWLKARLELLEAEKELTRRSDRKSTRLNYSH